MKVRTLKEFNDLQSKKLRKIGEEFEVSIERVEQINSTSHGTLVVGIKENKKVEKLIVDHVKKKKNKGKVV